MEHTTPIEPVEIGRATPYVFRVSVQPDEDRYYAEAPALPGCHSWGRTYEEAIQNIKEAVELWIDVMRESGEKVPLELPDAIRKAKVTIGILA